MRLKLACLALGALVALTQAAHANGYSSRPVAVPAPIPVPGSYPVPEGFTYYLRADLGWGFVGSDPSFSETGAPYGPTPLFFSSITNRSVDSDDVFHGSIGAGAYFTPRLRGDITLDFRGQQDVVATGTFVDGLVNGTVRETMRLRGTVGLVNAYWDLMPRGSFTPYVGAGVGFVYNDIDRTQTTDTGLGPGVTGSGKDNSIGLAAAVMAGVSFGFGNAWALDLHYRALFLDGGDVTTTVSGATSRANIGDYWEHQVRVGLRMNIW